ncbi:hypothetical protein EYF80_035142 [Liparis tanakae]|uniref:Uncharacterized protein n=1 Tax=Liparis tanakae TaxID=230148 RepID=A0A4Z2GN52_9TELE|nr:hypothetical protein EYF80_035142 [Liparis tanakae]
MNPPYGEHDADGSELQSNVQPWMMELQLPFMAIRQQQPSAQPSAQGPRGRRPGGTAPHNTLSGPIHTPSQALRVVGGEAHESSAFWLRVPLNSLRSDPPAQESGSSDSGEGQQEEGDVVRAPVARVRGHRRPVAALHQTLPQLEVHAPLQLHCGTGTETVERPYADWLSVRFCSSSSTLTTPSRPKETEGWLLERENREKRMPPMPFPMLAAPVVVVEGGETQREREAGSGELSEQDADDDTQRATCRVTRRGKNSSHETFTTLKSRLQRKVGRMWSWWQLVPGRIPLRAKNTARGEPMQKKFST